MKTSSSDRDGLATAFLHATRGVFRLRRAAERLSRVLGRQAPTPAIPPRAPRPEGAPKRRNILFITVDQQRHDALGVNGGRIARTPSLDALGRAGIVYHRAHVQNVVCMPSRSTMLTGQHPLTHGVVANGIALPDEGRSVAEVLRTRAGYRTALIGKAHFDPHLDPLLTFPENRYLVEGRTTPWHGFEHAELATHGPIGGHHYAAWLWENHPEYVRGFGGVLSGTGGGDTGAPEVKRNPIPRGLYHTDWLVDRAEAWLAAQPPDEPWFLWLSFPDPHHPFDPPADEVERRIDWRSLPLPAGHPGSREEIVRFLRQKPRHWLDWYEGRYLNPEGGPINFRPSALTHDQLREVEAHIHVENELIDEACGRLFASLRARGIDADTDIFYTSDHGDLQGTLGLLFKGPYHVDALLRVPLLWRPAPSAGITPAEVPEPVGHVDLAPTFCSIAGLDIPDWMQGRSLPTARGSDRSFVLTTFDSQFAQVGMHLRTIFMDGWICTVYEPSTHGVGGDFPLYWAIWGRGSTIPRYDGTEGELYDVNTDPQQWQNLWNDPARRKLRDDLVAELRVRLPPQRAPALPVAAPT
ncbi:sulfatase-like hydrolase/transferase [Polyangium sp. 6x1]|uniref:sulfatase family protein n=1 Tax=Polyangium sp. 6x1 TaxID=3042689 RepID=UPI0024823236|nr:sulfatase-like hydrolase/transferase [Polyangium sp. 6x1]MDI1446750.1 sulfatase-like hydrolase/transferase [Polyangium sp. 6x1]